MSSTMPRSAPAAPGRRYPPVLILVLFLLVGAPAFAALVDAVIGTKNSKVYHTHPTECSSARRISADNRVTFASIQEAEESGRRLCKVCADIDRRQAEGGGAGKPGKSGGKKTGRKSEPTPQDTPSGEEPQTGGTPAGDAAVPEFASVANVQTGGTIELDNGEKAVLVGVLCPEEGAPLAEDAARFIKEQTQGRRVKLARDPSPGPVGYYDDLGRMRVYLTPDPDGRDLGGELLFQGYAWLDRAASYDRRAEYSRREEEAWQAKRGIWKPLDGEAGRREVVTGRHASYYHEANCPRTVYLSGKMTLTLNEAKARRLPPAACCGERSRIETTPKDEKKSKAEKKS